VRVLGGGTCGKRSMSVCPVFFLICVAFIAGTPHFSTSQMLSAFIISCINLTSELDIKCWESVITVDVCTAAPVILNIDSAW